MARRISILLMGTNSGAGDNAGTAGLTTGTGNEFSWPGGDGMLMVDATFGGGTVALQMKSLSGVWMPLQNYATSTPISLTVAGVANFKAPAGPVRVLATTATAVNAQVIGIPSNIAG